MKEPRIIDLTLEIKEGMQTFPTPWHPFVEISQLGRHGIKNRETRKITLGTHTGTHMDAPRHFVPDGITIDKIPLDILVGPATVVDFSDVEPFYKITVNDFKNALNNSVPKKLIVRFDWDKHIGTTKYYIDHPYLSEKACSWLVDNGCILIRASTKSFFCF